VDDAQSVCSTHLLPSFPTENVLFAFEVLCLETPLLPVKNDTGTVVFIVAFPTTHLSLLWESKLSSLFDVLPLTQLESLSILSSNIILLSLSTDIMKHRTIKPNQNNFHVSSTNFFKPLKITSTAHITNVFPNNYTTQNNFNKFNKPYHHRPPS
jgi:hypothetical protein